MAIVSFLFEESRDWEGEASNGIWMELGGLFFSLWMMRPQTELLPLRPKIDNIKYQLIFGPKLNE